MTLRTKKIILLVLLTTFAIELFILLRPKTRAQEFTQDKYPGPGKLAVCIDDAGESDVSFAAQKEFEKIDIPFTLAIMPNQEYTQAAAKSWAKTGRPLIVHQPMEIKNTPKENHEAFPCIFTDMSRAEISRILDNAFAQLPQAMGLNNHQGSKVSEDPRTMDIVVQELKARKKFFFDSATSPIAHAQGPLAAAKHQIPYARNQFFIDNSSEVDKIKERIYTGARVAKNHGTAILIGHARPNTAKAFREILPELKKQNVEFIPLTDLIEIPSPKPAKAK